MSADSMIDNIVNLSLDSDVPHTKQQQNHTGATAPSDQSPRQSLPSHFKSDSTTSIVSSFSDGGSSSAPDRPQRSPLRRSLASSSIKRNTMDITALMLDADSLQGEVTMLLDKIYEIEELRHSPSARVGHASRLDALLHQVDRSIEALAPRMTPLEGYPMEYDSDVFSPLRADWAKVIAQHQLLREELQEDPWLIRFRTTAEQADGMMDPLQSSLIELTSYVGRIFTSFTAVPMYASDNSLSIERLRNLALAHARLKSTYIPSINKIIRMMDKSVSERKVKNGEALRRLNDMHQRWITMQKQLVQLDAKVALVLSQNDPDHSPYDDKMDVFQDQDGHYLSPPHMSNLPSPAHMQNENGAGLAVPLTRVTSADSSRRRREPSETLAPPPPLFNRQGSITPSAQRSLRRSQSRPSLPHTGGYGSPSTSRIPLPPMPPQYAAPQYASPGPRRASHTSLHRPTSPSISSTSPSESLSGYSRTPVKSSLKPPRMSLPASTPPMPVMPGTVRASYMPPQATPPSHLSASVGRPGHMRPPPSAYRSGPSPIPGATNVNSTPNRPPSRAFPRPPSRTPSRAVSRMARPTSRMSAASERSHNAALTAGVLRPFEPSRYDLLDLEVQKILTEVQPNIFVARIDQALKRGQRKGEGETWTGEFLFGAGEKNTAVKLLEMTARGGGTGKRVKCMVRAGGAWQELGAYLARKKTEQMEEVF